MFAPTFCFFAFFFSVSFYDNVKCTISKIKSQPPTETTPGSDIEQTNDNKLNNTNTTTIPQTQSYTNAIQSLINNTNVRVKIADLGNACYEVRQSYTDLIFRTYSRLLSINL